MVFKIMNVISDTVINLLHDKSQFYDNHDSMLNKIIELAYFGFIKYDKHQPNINHIYVALLNDESYNIGKHMYMKDDCILFIINADTYLDFIEGKQIDFFEDFESNIFSNIKRIWNIEDVKTQLIFR